MGVHGLWRLIEPSGKPVPLETLENKVLAVDISIWLHQAIKGFQDAKGAAVPNAHLLGIYHRVCKLLYFKIKPVFVFDGGVPALKKQTIAKRNQLKSKNSSEADKLQKQLLSTLLKHTAISKVLSEKTKASIAAQTKKSPKGKDELFKLPSSEMDSTISSSSEEEEEDVEDASSDTTEPSPLKQYDLHTIDTKSPYFQSLPLETKHEILTELKGTRKQSSWGQIHKLPKKSDDFSSYQMKRLLKRQQVQEALDETAKEMGGASLSLTELETLLNDQGIPTSNNVGQRIASDSTTRFLYIKDVKEALEKAKIAEEKKKEQPEPVAEDNPKPKTKADLEEEEELQRAIALSLEGEPSTSSGEKKGLQDFSFLENFKDEDFMSDSSDEEFEEVPVKKKMSSAQSYMLEYSGLTPSEIAKIISQNSKKNLKKSSKAGRIVLNADPVQKANVLPTSKNLAPQNLESIAEVSEEACDSTTNIDSSIESTEENIAIETNNIIHVKEVPSDQITEEVTESRKDNSSTENTKDVEIGKVSSTKEQSEDKTEAGQEESIETISDTESSSSEELIPVEDDSPEQEDKPDIKKQLHLIINAEKLANETDDLFSDIFEDEKALGGLDEILSKVKVETNENVAEKRSVSHEKQLKLNKDGNDEPFIQEHVVGTSDKIVEETKVSADTVKSTESIAEEKREKIVVESTEEIEAKQTVETHAQPSVSDSISKEVQLAVKTLDISELEEMRDNLQREKIDLLVEKSTKERMATNISDQMYQEAQELLELFGVPYVIAPMEAEAQCAFLDEIELVDGTITDDSDIWLFGGRTVYKNFFDQAKYVMEFKAENIKHHFKLSRQQMILLALLVGSDYTIGVRGIGPVTALEILSVFPPPEASEFDVTQAQLVSGLREFKAWFNKGQSGGPGRSSLKNKLKNITFTDNFPNVQVVQAYMEPTVETSKENFSWCKPDFVALTLYAREKFGWSSKKTEEILNPVIKRVEESRIQKSIKEYFKTKFKLDNGDMALEKMSKRVKLAIERFGKTPEELIAEEMELLEQERQKKLKKREQIVEKEKKKRPIKEEKSGESSKRRHKEEEPEKAKRKHIEETEKGDKKDSGKAKDTKEKGGDKMNRSEEATSAEDTAKASKRRTSKKKILGDPENDDFISEPPKKISRKKESTEGAGSEEGKPKSKKKPNLVKKVENVSRESKPNPAEELELYTNVAIELRQRRQRKNELSKLKMEEAKKPRKKTPDVPKELAMDPEVQHLLATTSKSVQKVQEIRKEAEKKLSEEKRRSTRLPGLHSKEVIHQRLKDQSDILKNRLKAIEVFRKSKKGPGYVSKSTRQTNAPKEDAGLSEDSDS